MTKRDSIASQEHAVLVALKRFPTGASLVDIQQAATLQLDTRQLQRRLKDLSQIGKIERRGKSRATTYHLLPIFYTESDAAASTFASTLAEPPANEYVLCLSKEGVEIKRLVTQPLAKRKPVGFNRHFLESYRPNIDFYLSEQEREKLAKLGRTGDLPIKEAATYAKKILNRILIDLSWNSSRLEGNSYSLLETERLIEFGKEADDKSALEAQMILNHKEAIEFIVQSAEELQYDRYAILNLHALLANNLLSDPLSPGRLRTIPIGIKKSVYVPLAIPQLIDAMFNLMLEKANKIIDPFEQAFFIMVHLPYLQPFEDVNKRSSRLAMNIAFNRHNLSPLSFIDVPHDLYIQGLIGVYELNRVELLKDIFIWAYDRSSARYSAARQSVGEPDPFRIKYRTEMKELVHQIVAENMDLKKAIHAITEKAKSLASHDRPKFVETVETELLYLHEGNFARYKVTPAEFRRWNESWKQG